MKARITEKTAIFTVRHYKLVMVREFHKKNFYGDYLKENKVNSGCYELEWELRFSSEKKLREQLKKWYPNTRSVYFYTHLNAALKGEYRIYDYQMTICENGHNSDGKMGFILQKPRRRCRKKRNWHWDDMYYTDYKEFNQKIVKQDQLKIDLVDIKEINFGRIPRIL